MLVSAGPKPDLLLQRLARHAAKMPDQTAYRLLRDDAAEQSLTYGQLERSVHAVAGHLREAVRPGDRALLLYPQELSFLPAFLGCLAAGVIAVPVAPPRPNRKAVRLQGIIADCSPAIVLTTAEVLPKLTPDALGCQPPPMLATDEIQTGALCDCLPENPLEDIAFLQYTSGSTGTPKGVIVTHAALAHNARQIATAFRHENLASIPCGVSWLPLFHDMGLVGGILQSLHVGGISVLLSPAGFLRDPWRWLKAVSDYRCITTGGPNFAFDHCVRRVTEEQKRGLDLSSLKVLYNGSEPIRGETLDRFSAAFAVCGFRPEVFLPCYGLAEATLFVSGGPAEDEPQRLWVDAAALEEGRVRLLPEGRAGGRCLVSSGEPAEGAEVNAVDVSTRTVVSAGRVGALWVASPSVGSGYWGRDDESRATFANYLADGTGPFLDTGDLGFVHGGEVFVTGRTKDMIIVRGRNIYPQDVEAVVEQALPFIEANACAAFAIDEGGEEQLALVIEADRAMVRTARSAQSGDAAAAAELAAAVVAVRQVVSTDFEIAVATVVFVRPATFPRTSSGKVQRGACKAALREGTLEIVHASTAHADNGKPAGVAAAKELIQSCICRCLSEHDEPVPPNIDGDTPFTSLGLDSVAATIMALEIEKATGVRLSADILYECQTINRLSNYLASRRCGCVRPASHVKIPTPGVNGHCAVQARTSERSGTPSRRGADLLSRYAQRMEPIRGLKQAGQYFFETPFASYDGAKVTAECGRFLMFSSYSYLGLIGHPEVNAAVCKAIERFGAGCHGARLIAGTTTLHHELEAELAAFLGADAAVVFNTGYVTNLATVAALVGPGDVVIGDEYNHASIADGCRFSQADCMTFKHNDVADLERRLQESAGRSKLVAVDSVYSMEGDIAPLPDVVKLCNRYDALLMVDEAHSLGVLGATGRGAQEHFALPADAIDIKMGTLSKSLGSCGGYIAGRADLVEYLKHTARGYLFSVATPVPQVAAALTALRILKREPERVAQLQRNTQRLIEGLRQNGLQLTATTTPIVPVLCGTEQRTLAVTEACRREGLFVIPIFYPAVPMNAPRVRLSVIASHSEQDIDTAISVLARVAAEVDREAYVIQQGGVMGSQ